MKTRSKYVTESEVKVGVYTMALQWEVVSLPKGYDECGPPPRIRVVLNGPESAAEAVESLADLGAVVRKTHFPIEQLLQKHPEESASMVAYLADLRRPIQKSGLFETLGESLGAKLDNLVPKFDHGQLVWCELHWEDCVLERRLDPSNWTLSVRTLFKGKQGRFFKKRDVAKALDSKVASSRHASGSRRTK